MKITTKMLLLLLVSTCAAAPFSILDQRKIPHIHEDKKIDKKVDEDSHFELDVHDDKKVFNIVTEAHPVGLNVHEDVDKLDMEHAHQDGLQVEGDNQINELKANETYKREGKSVASTNLTPGTCYKDTRSRLLGRKFNFKTTNTPQKCINKCLKKGYDYAGVQYYHECFCGNDEPPASRIRPSSECDAKCTGNSKLKCGGSWRMNIYPTGVFWISGGSIKEGNVFYNGAPICDDEWDDTNAGVFCRMMGYQDGTATTQSRYGQVSSDFSMDDVVCTGIEHSLLDCSHNREDNCGTSEGAGVICTGSCAVQVGSSHSNTKSATVSKDCVCPRIVNKNNWLGGYKYDDTFQVKQLGTDLEVLRKDSDSGWGMNLSFMCTYIKAETCPKEKGYCVLPNGNDQNSGVIKLDSIDGNTIEQQTKCLSRCQAYRGATGCEVIWNQSNRGCYVHTQQIARGNHADRHACWVFSKKCTVPTVSLDYECNCSPNDGKPFTCSSPKPTSSDQCSDHDHCPSQPVCNLKKETTASTAATYATTTATTAATYETTTATTASSKNEGGSNGEQDPDVCDLVDCSLKEAEKHCPVKCGRKDPDICDLVDCSLNEDEALKHCPTKCGRKDPEICAVVDCSAKGYKDICPKKCTNAASTATTAAPYATTTASPKACPIGEISAGDCICSGASTNTCTSGQGCETAMGMCREVCSTLDAPITGNPCFCKLQGSSAADLCEVSQTCSSTTGLCTGSSMNQVMSMIQQLQSKINKN